MRLVSKYILREHAAPLIFSASALTSMLLLNYIAKQLPNLVGKGLDWGTISEFIALSLPFTIAMTLPMAVLVATLHAFSRLASDSEITAFKASGMAIPRLMLPVIVGGMVLSGVMVWFNDQVMPRANHRLSTLTNDIGRKKPTFILRPQVINEVVAQRLYLRAGHLEPISGAMRDVDIYDLSDAQHRRTIRAQSGTLAFTADGRDLILTLHNGTMTEISKQEMGRLQRVSFTSDRYRVKDVSNDLTRNSSGGERSDREMTICELHRRLGRAMQKRDSSLGVLKRVDPKTASKLGRHGMGSELGKLYCQAIALSLVKSANAAQQQVDSAKKRPALGRVPQGTTLPAADPDPTPVVIEGLKLELGNAETAIDGYSVEIEKKFAIATACVIFVLLGAPVALRFPRGGVGMTIGVSLAVFGLYYCGLLGGESLARRGYLPPFIAMWMTNAILLGIGLALLVRLGREGTTTRGSETGELLARLRDRFLRRKSPAF